MIIDLSANVPISGRLMVAQNAAFNDGGHRRPGNRVPKRIRERQFDRLPTEPYLWLAQIMGEPN